MTAPNPSAETEERARLARKRLGQVVLGKWKLERLLALGGMAAVFEARHESGSRAAIKILHGDLAGSEEYRERFLAEAYTANRVAHPGVVTVRDEGTTEDGAVFLVMDLLRGKTLAERLAPGGEALSVGEVLEMARQLLDVLTQAHDRGIVHRDIKPENVFLTSEGRVRLLDFGCARLQSSRARQLTPLGSVVGTPDFMPPEQALGDAAGLDGRADLWALGAIMYLLLSGSPVRAGGDATSSLLSAMTQPVPSLGEVADLPRSVVAVVDRALAFDRAERFPDARSMQLAVRAAIEELAPGSAETALPSSLTPIALSLRTPRPLPRGKSSQRRRDSQGSLPPVAAYAAPHRAPPSPRGRSALPVYVLLGFALGMGMVVATRLSTWHPRAASSAAPLTAVVPELGPEPVPSTLASAAPSSSASARPRLAAHASAAFQ